MRKMKTTTKTTTKNEPINSNIDGDMISKLFLVFSHHENI